MAKAKKQKKISVGIYLSQKAYREALKDAEDQDRGVSYIMSKIVENHYKAQGRISDDEEESDEEQEIRQK
ncbi:MAG: hypothetical protein IPO07_12615 [Haliscomenobacter sp.]|nr:hypothetical protein [Haliscomenobacter sp.]MBK9489527.1 hypothetical protein [Haliscomenobacter sp.]